MDYYAESMNFSVQNISTLDQMKLLYNNIMDVWVVLCEEKEQDWSDVDNYLRFIKYLQENEIRIDKIGVCASEVGKRAYLLKRSFKILGDPNKTYVIRTDPKTISSLRAFPGNRNEIS